MKGKLHNDDGSWVVEYKEFPVIYFLPLHPKDAKLISNYDKNYFKIVEFDIIEGYAKLIDSKSIDIEVGNGFWDTIKSVLSKVFKQGQHNYKMMESGLEGDECDEYVELVMKDLKSKYNNLK